MKIIEELDIVPGYTRQMLFRLEQKMHLAQTIN
jgi:hypothetical protein